MNTMLVNSAAGVIMAALTQNRTAAGIALALESAQLLQSPETAAELERLRTERDNWKASFEAERKSRNEELGQHNEEYRGARRAADGWKAQVDELKARLAEYERPVDEDPITYALTDKAAAVFVGCDNCGTPDLCAPAGSCARLKPPREDVTPKVAKLRALLAGQREQAGGES